MSRMTEHWVQLAADKRQYLVKPASVHELPENNSMSPLPVGRD